MNIHSWKIFDKKGSFVNWYRDNYLDIDFITDALNAIGANAYAVTDVSGIINEVFITDSGWNYNAANTYPILNYTFNPTNESIDLSSDSSITYIDVTIFDPNPNIVSGIGSMTIDLSTQFIYPSVSYSGAFFLDPVAVGLVETEHLTILQDTSIGYIRPYEPNTHLVFRRGPFRG